jgi:hypothetical protein
MGAGIELARAHYEREVAPGLRGVPHAAALIGPGSEVLGYDDQVSTDHDFGARVMIFRDVPGQRAGDYFAAQLGVDPALGMGVADWLCSPTQVLASLTAGAVFHDPRQELASRRAALAWYPADVWRYALAAGWLRVAQEEAFVGRAGSTGDDLGSRLIAGRLVRELMRLAFLVSRRWAPYPKWFGRAFTELDLAAGLAPLLAGALAAPHWRDREAALVAAAGVVGAATNALSLAEPVDPAPRQYFERDIRVIGADRFTVALAAAVTDPVLRRLIDGPGLRHGRVPRLPGTIDQVTDSTDVLGVPGMARTVTPLPGRLPASG